MIESDDSSGLDDDNPLKPAALTLVGSVEDISAPAVRALPGIVEEFVAIIRGAPCGGSGADYVDARYYLDRAAPRPTLKTSDILATSIEVIPGVKECVTATNLAELADGTHLLAVGTLVEVFAINTRGQPAAKLHVFNQAARLAMVVKITGNATGAGEYNGRVLFGISNASAGSGLTMPAGMGVPTSDDALVINTEEDGIPGHRLAAGTYAVGVVRGMTSEHPARQIVVLRGGVGRLDSPTGLGAAVEGSETADSSSWSRSGDGTPVGVYMVSRTVYNETGDRVLYSFVRQLSFDARGLLASVSGETRITVDATEACP